MILTYGAARPPEETITPRRRLFPSYGDFGFSLTSALKNIGSQIDPTKQGSLLNTAAGKISPGLQTALTTTGQLNKGSGGGAAPAAGAPGGTFIAGPGGIQFQPSSFATTYKWPLIGAGSLLALGLVALLIRSRR